MPNAGPDIAKQVQTMAPPTTLMLKGSVLSSKNKPNLFHQVLISFPISFHLENKVCKCIIQRLWKHHYGSCCKK